VHAHELNAVVLRELLWLLSNLFAAASSEAEQDDDALPDSLLLLFKYNLCPRRRAHALLECRNYPGVLLQVAWLFRNATCHRKHTLIQALLEPNSIYVPCDLLESEEPDVLLPAMVCWHGFCGAQSKSVRAISVY